MTKEFIPYEQVLELEELGFDEKCLSYPMSNTDISGGDITNCCKGALKSVGGFVWRYKTNIVDVKIYIESVNNEKSILQYSKEGIFIKKWKSAKEASEALQIDRGSISACCKGKYRSSGGFFWKYKEKELEN